MKEDHIAANLGRIVRIRTTDGESEAVLKQRAPNNGHWEVTDPNGKTVAVTAEQILGVKRRTEDAASDEPECLAAASERMPDDTWQLPALAAFITAACRRSAVEAWWIGMALLIARAKHKEERDWLRWLKEEVEGLSKSTSYRYMDVCQTFELAEVEGTTLNVLYKLMAIKDDDSEVAAEDGKGRNANHDTKPQPPTTAKSSRRNPPANDEPDIDHDREDKPEPPAPPQSPVTAAEIDALEAFVASVGGMTRAEYVFHEGIEQLRDLKNDN